MAIPETLTVIGAGPVGSLLALTLARRGFDVEVYERRPDMRRHDISAGRSINLAVSTRGLHALEQVGLQQEVLTQAVPMRGRMMHAVSGELTFQRYGKDDSQFINSMSRGGINKMVMDAAERAHEEGAGRVRIHFHQRLVDYDVTRREARFKDERTGEEHVVEAPVVLGSDGTASALRGSLVKDAGIGSTSDVLSAGYKELTMPPAKGGLGEGGRFALEPHALHIWPRGNFMLIALANQDGSFTCTLFLPFEAPAGQPCFAQLTDAPAAQAFFERHFPDAVPLIPGLAEAFMAAPLGQMTTVKTWPWSHGAAVLLGDAAHGIVPFFGQGMNAGFEDCTVLDGLLARRLTSEGRERLDWAALFREFAETRKPHTDAIAELAVDNFVEMRDRVGDRRFLLQKAVEVELQRRFPGKYVSRYGLVTFSRVPYRVALEAGRIQEGLLAELCGGVERPEDVDYTRAEQLLDERLVPFLKDRGVL
ncbi:MAG: FAD-dependent monooxygenase [Myxococcaceae bacterium]|nr:FAD-dependent monooxygenase [Myxococcaceae bacterium]MCI0668945.1 FAD-dependent monooxygenase [Myxococcaceae bacterium]